MRISIKHLDDGLHSYNFCEPVAACGVADHPNLRSDAEIFVEMEKRSPHFFVNTHVGTTGHFACDRCLAEFDMRVEERSRVIFSSDPDMLALAGEDIHAVAKDANEIDITDDVRATLLLALPQKAVCRPDCQGWCSHCGVNLNEESCRCGPHARDARWAGLDKFLERS